MHDWKLRGLMNIEPLKMKTWYNLKLAIIARSDVWIEESSSPFIHIPYSYAMTVMLSYKWIMGSLTKSSSTTWHLKATVFYIPYLLQNVSSDCDEILYVDGAGDNQEGKSYGLRNTASRAASLADKRRNSMPQVSVTLEVCGTW